MAKVKFFCDSGANIHSCREEIIDTVEDWGMEDEDWDNMSDDDKYQMAAEWANDRLDIGFEEL